MTTLAELTLRLQKLYSRKFGSSEIVHIIQESGKVCVCVCVWGGGGGGELCKWSIRAIAHHYKTRD